MLPPNPRGNRALLSPLLETAAARHLRRQIQRVIGSRRFQCFGTIVRRVEVTAPVVALTFDDGPDPVACEVILPALREQGVRATFFIVGSHAEQVPGLLMRMLADGHELGNHGYTHRRLVLKSLATIQREIERTDAVIRQAGQRGDIAFRPPYCAKLIALPWYLARTRRRTVTWDVEPEAASAGEIVERLLAQVRPGSIVMMHPMGPTNQRSREAIPGAIAGLRARGLGFVTVSQLLSLGSHGGI